MYPAGVEGIVVRRIVVRDGVALRVLEAGPRGKLTALLLHGWASSVYSFAETIPALAAAGYRVVAVDLPGHGLSDKPIAPECYSVPAMTDAVAAVMADCGVERCVMVAHSMSGAIALEMAGRGDSRLSGVVFIGAVGVGRVPLAPVARLLTPRFAVAALPPLLGRGLAGLVASFAFGTRERPTPRDVDEYWAPTQFDGFARALVSCLHRANWHREPVEFLRAFSLPTLVIAGTRDRVVWGVAGGGRMVAGARVVEVPGAGHLIMQESAAVVNALLLDFLGQLRSSKTEAITTLG